VVEAPGRICGREKALTTEDTKEHEGKPALAWGEGRHRTSDSLSIQGNDSLLDALFQRCSVSIVIFG